MNKTPIYPSINAVAFAIVGFSFRKKIPNDDASNGPVKPMLEATAKGRLRYV